MSGSQARRTLATRLATYGSLPFGDVLDLGADVAELLAGHHDYGRPYRRLTPAAVRRGGAGPWVLSAPAPAEAVRAPGADPSAPVPVGVAIDTDEAIAQDRRDLGLLLAEALVGRPVEAGDLAATLAIEPPDVPAEHWDRLRTLLTELVALDAAARPAADAAAKRLRAARAAWRARRAQPWRGPDPDDVLLAANRTSTWDPVPADFPEGALSGSWAAAVGAIAADAAAGAERADGADGDAPQAIAGAPGATAAEADAVADATEGLRVVDGPAAGDARHDEPAGDEAPGATDGLSVPAVAVAGASLEDADRDITVVLAGDALAEAARAAVGAGPGAPAVVEVLDGTGVFRVVTPGASVPGGAAADATEAVELVPAAAPEAATPGPEPEPVPVAMDEPAAGPAPVRPDPVPVPPAAHGIRRFAVAVAAATVLVVAGGVLALRPGDDGTVAARDAAVADTTPTIAEPATTVRRWSPAVVDLRHRRTPCTGDCGAELRAERSPFAGVLARLEHGTPVEAECIAAGVPERADDRTTDNRWVRGRAAGTDGWVSALYLDEIAHLPDCVTVPTPTGPRVERPAATTTSTAPPADEPDEAATTTVIEDEPTTTLVPATTTTTRRSTSTSSKPSTTASTVDVPTTTTTRSTGRRD